MLYSCIFNLININSVCSIIINIYPLNKFNILILNYIKEKNSHGKSLEMANKPVPVLTGNPRIDWVWVCVWGIPDFFSWVWGWVWGCT